MSVHMTLCYHFRGSKTVWDIKEEKDISDTECNAEHGVMCALRERDFCGEMRVEVDLEAWIDF